jgi:hypothetical protein
MKTVAVMAAALAVAVASVAAVLATASGAVAAIAWARHTFGSIPVAIAGAFVAGAAIMHAVDRGLDTRHRRAASGQPEPER